MRTTRPALAALALLATVLVALPTLAQEDKAAIGYRQKVMGSIGANMGGIGDILKFGLPHGENIAGHASNISTNARMIPAAFEQRVTEGKTDAKPDIWENWSTFEDAAARLERESAKLAEVAASGDMRAIGAQVKAVGDACKNCHQDFRKPKEESYKRR